MNHISNAERQRIALGKFCHYVDTERMSPNEASVQVTRDMQRLYPLAPVAPVSVVEAANRANHLCAKGHIACAAHPGGECLLDHYRSAGLL